MASPYALTVDGYETQWQTNYLSHFLLIKALLPNLSSAAAEATSPGRVRIVSVSSDAAFVPIAPSLNLENPNLDSIKGIMAAWCISLLSPFFRKMDIVLPKHALHSLPKSSCMNANDLGIQEALLSLQNRNRPTDSPPT